MELGLRGRNVVITGATRGIGRAIAEGFVREGANVGLCARDSEQVAKAVEAFRRAGVNAAGAALDIADAGAARAWVAEMAGQLVGIDVFISNVSALGTRNDEATWRNSVEVDLLGTVAVVEAALPFVERSVAGSITL
ncbi:MAG TPA: SDR family NAD(P)-dependent oxidoreductase, partial [Acetobacteraceae bacterium]|nr:SDR family NAD(P)-dependent oxidoreductase [Acetobacteraceae bacterium]